MRHMDKYDITQRFTAQPSVTDTSLSIDPPTKKPQKRIQSEVQNWFSFTWIFKCDAFEIRKLWMLVKWILFFSWEGLSISRNALACTILKILCCRKTSQITNNLSLRIPVKSFCGKNLKRSPISTPMIPMYNNQDNAQIVWQIEHRMWTRRYLWGIQRLVSTHLLGGGGVFLATQNSKSESWPNFHWGEGVFLATQNSKVGYYWQNEPTILEPNLFLHRR